jgi:CDP-glucose 4,6-dehydratase
LANIVADFKPDIIFHLAAQALVQESLRIPLATIATNTLGSATVLDVAKDYPAIKAIIMVTSDKVYENYEWAWSYRETDQLGGKDPYSASKAASELVINSFLRCYFADTGTIVAIGRAGNVIGGGDWALNRIIPDCIRAWTAGQPVSIRNPLATRPWQHVLEPLSGYLRLATLALNGNRTINHQAYNFGPEPQTNQTVEELLKAMTVRWPKGDWRVKKDPEKLGASEAGLLKLSCEKASNELGWRPTWSFEDTLAYTVDWYRTHATSHDFDAYASSVGQINDYCAANASLLVEPN